MHWRKFQNISKIVTYSFRMFFERTFAESDERSKEIYFVSNYKQWTMKCIQSFIFHTINCITFCGRFISSWLKFPFHIHSSRHMKVNLCALQIHFKMQHWHIICLVRHQSVLYLCISSQRGATCTISTYFPPKLLVDSETLLWPAEAPGSAFSLQASLQRQAWGKTLLAL